MKRTFTTILVVANKSTTSMVANVLFIVLTSFCLIPHHKLQEAIRNKD